MASSAKPRHSTMEEARQLLSASAFFRGLDIADRDALFAHVRLRQLGAGEPIFLMGAPGTSMMAVLHGKVRISVPSPDGKELVLKLLQPGDILGEIALLDGKERTADATAVTACDLAVLDRRDVRPFLERHPHACLRLLEVLCQRLRDTDRHIAEVALMQLPVRLAKTLLRLAQGGERAAAGDAVVAVPVSQRELGNMVGATRESVNKCLGDWQRRGIVRMEEGQIMILDAQSLEVIAEGR